MIYLQLAYEFLKIGIFSFGGGYATIPFLVNISEIYNWYSINELTHMIAIASMTPGPVGINVATYAGIKTAGITGAIIATSSEVLPSLILVITVSKLLKKYNNNFYAKAIVKSLKPISCALLISVAFELLKSELSDIKGLILLTLLFILSIRAKREPIIYISVAALYGISMTFISKLI